MNYIQDNLVSNEVQGMIVGYGVGLGSDERTILYGCSNHKEGPEHEATVHGGDGGGMEQFCKRSMTISAIGNRICNGHLNVPAYGFDFGDCCLPELQCVSPYHALICNFSYFW